MNRFRLPLAACLLPLAMPALADDAAPAAPLKNDWAHLRSYELPAITVQGDDTPVLKEEEYVGAYGQPRWTATRCFTGTRAYVAPEGQVEVEGWARTTITRDKDANGDTIHEERYLQEITLGLPNRFQLDFYLRQDHSSEDDKTNLAGQFEMRYALANWGEIWGNPTIYLEYIAKNKDNPDTFEPKLLFSGELAPRWHWATNFALEADLGGARTHEWGWTGGLMYALVDSKFSVGSEFIFHATDEIETNAAGEQKRSKLAYEFLVGPSIKWKPTPATMVNFAPLVGIGHDSAKAQIYLNAGWEL